jgi:hypothetical protein
MTDEQSTPERDSLIQEVVKYTPEEKERIGSAMITAAQQNAAEIGKRLIEVATSRNERAFIDTVINQAAELVTHLNNLYLADEKLQKEIALFKKRIAAIEAGEYKLGSNGRLQYNDILLNY